MTMTRMLAFTTLLLISAGPALAQDNAAVTDINTPEACKSAMGGQAMMGNPDQMQAMMEQHMGANAGEANKDLMRAMAAMNPSMMQGMMLQDADMAFACSMLAHHQGAIAMARVELEHGKDEEMKKMAQKMIDDQTREVGEMTKWIEAHAAK